ncbi:Alpha-L-fucosidase [Planctomycetes bacterium Poly30]|uniref:alpha-L-fucosidase n=1 Tax=Saltatorellus ferox TaxID=2528018 RepID=A0A518EYQ8_9BACT|nr:Alpha-L-fucosidase [Planctomycetes bacterium Poly30]
MGLAQEATYDDLVAGFEDPPARARPDAFWAWLNGHADPARITEEMEAFRAAGFSALQIWDVKAHRDPEGIVPVGPAFLSDEWLANLAHANREALRLGLDLGMVAASGWNAGGSWVEPEHAGLSLFSSVTRVQGPRGLELTLPFPATPEHAPRDAEGRPAYWSTVAVQAVPAGDGAGFEADRVIDLTGKTDDSGHLQAELPAGEWDLRWFIRANSGQRLIVPSPNSDGLQIDFFDADDSRWYFHHVLDRLESALGPLDESALKYLEVDSLELEGGRLSAWTEDILTAFRAEYGYDAAPWLTFLVDDSRSPEAAERFLRDWTRLVSDLMIENHYRIGNEVLRERGLLLSAEAGGPGPPIWSSCPVDAIGALGATGLARGEFWPKHRSMYNVKEIACAAHVYGKRIVDSESFTSWRHWQDLPYYLKLLADQAFLDGLNHITFHTAPHGGGERGLPGYAYHAGTHIGPNLVWWPMVKPFIEYLARCSFLLQEGTPVEDVCFYQGAGAPVFHPLGVDWDPRVRPLGYDYDVVDVRMLLNGMTVEGGRLSLPSGVSYRMLVLPEAEPMDRRVTEKLEELVRAGGRVLGPDGLVAALTEAPPDFLWEGGDARTRLGFVHRSGEEFEIYYVVNHHERWESVHGIFRVDGLQPEIWDPSSGAIREAAWERSEDGRTRVALALPPGGSRFVVFRRMSDGGSWNGDITLGDLARAHGAGVDVAHGDTPNGPAWLSSGENGPGDEFIVYDLGAEVALEAMDLWAYQDQTRGLLTRAIKELAVSTSIDGAKFEAVGSYTLRRAPDIGERDYEERVALMAPKSRFVRFDVVSNHSDDWSGHTSIVGLGRVEFLTAGERAIEGVRVHDVSSGVAHDPATDGVRASHRDGFELTGPWMLEFPLRSGESKTIELESLAPWGSLEDPDLRHFSGIATYARTFAAPSGLASSGDSVDLDLGRLAGVARIFLNGEELGVAWHPPYAIDVTKALRSGLNELRVEVANTWHNRLVGDAALPPEGRSTVTNIRAPFTPETALLEAGILGPVQLVSTVDAAATRPSPRPAQLAWQEAEFGVVFHYDLHVCGEGRYVQRDARVHPVEDLQRFAPAELDTDQWVRSARDAGARFAILTGSHETGFRLWQSDVNPYCMKALDWGDGQRDIVGEFHASCLKYGLKPGIYLGTRWNAQLGVHDFQVTERSSLTQAEYNRLIEQEVEEICTRYGDWFEFWFDGGAHGPDQGGPDVLSIVERHQPDAVFYHNLQRADARWGGSESGTVPYPCWATFPYPATGSGESARPEISAGGFALLKSGDPEGAFWLPAMSDAPLRGHGGHEWFWEPDQEHLIYPLEKLVDMYCRSVGHNSTLILGLTPDDRGLLPEADATRLAELGQALKEMFGTPLAETDESSPGPSTALPIVLELPPETPFNLIVIEEDVERGEHVRRYHIEILNDGVWHEIAAGTCVGHKRIHRLATPQRGSALRLVVDEASSPAHIRRLSIGAK